MWPARNWTNSNVMVVHRLILLLWLHDSRGWSPQWLRRLLVLLLLLVVVVERICWPVALIFCVAIVTPPINVLHIVWTVKYLFFGLFSPSAHLTGRPHFHVLTSCLFCWVFTLMSFLLLVSRNFAWVSSSSDHSSIFIPLIFRRGREITHFSLLHIKDVLLW